MAKERKKAKIVLFVAGAFAGSAASELCEQAKKSKLKVHVPQTGARSVESEVSRLVGQANSERESFEKELHKLLDKHIVEDRKEELKLFRRDDTDIMIMMAGSIKDALRWHNAMRKKAPEFVSCVVVSLYHNRLTVYRNNWKESIHDSNAEKIITSAMEMAEAHTSKKLLLTCGERELIRKAVTKYKEEINSREEEDLVRGLMSKLGY